MKAFGRALTLLLTLCFAGTVSAKSEERKVYVFGNSLIHHATDSDETTVPHWLAYFAALDGNTLGLDGQWGFMRNFAGELPPKPNWGFKNVTSAWSRQFRSFEQVGFDVILVNPANFIQYKNAAEPYDGENPLGTTPLGAASDLLNGVSADKRFVIYEGWADMAPFASRFPPRARGLRKYHAFNQGDYHAWYVDFAAQLQQLHPEATIELIPVARILARAFQETDLRDIPVQDLYSDDAPHGTATLYFLAAAATYAGLYDALPQIGTPPSTVHPLVAQNFDAFLSILGEEVGQDSAAAAVPANIVTEVEEPAEEPVAETPVEVATIDESEDTTPRDVVATTDTQSEFVPALGMGLEGIADWSTQVPFVDHMKSARHWVGHLPGQWGGWGMEELINAGALDDHGWPTRIPPQLDKIETFMLTEISEEVTNLEGIYRLTYEGKGTLNIGGTTRAVRYGTNEIWFHFAPGDGSIVVSISDTDPEGTGDYIRNISVVREDQIPLHELGVVFNPDWVARVQDVRSLRFMDWMFTNGSPIQTWDERPRVEDFSYSNRGVPLSLMLELSNQIGIDPWFTMPHQADDEYVRNFAEAVRTGLRPGLRAHVEYSNEVWNFLFPQAHWAVEQANMRWGEDKSGDAWLQFAGARAAEVMDIWTEVFGDEAATRLKRVVATHTGWPGLEEGLLQAPLAVAEGAKPPVESFDAYAVTGYFGLELGNEDGPKEVLEWLKADAERENPYDMAVQKAVAALRTGSFKTLLTEEWPYQAEIARANGLELIMYEGGTHVVGIGDWTGNDDLTAFFNHLNYTPEMATLYRELLEQWTALGGTMFNAYVDVAEPSQWGSWGALRHLQDDNPRYDALLAYNTAGAAWGDGRSYENFANGLRLGGSPVGDILVGTIYSDIILAGEGDDELVSVGGHDYLHGGEGLDHVVLPGALDEFEFIREGNRLHAKSRHGDVRMVGVETLAFAAEPNVILSVSDFF